MGNRIVKQKQRGKVHEKKSINLQVLNLKVFEHPNTECRYAPDGTAITEKCAHTLRLCTASWYFETLKTSPKMDEAARRALFVEFNEEVYHSVLDDTAHFIKEHGDDILRVHNEWTEQYGFPTCTVSECAQTQRHYGRRSRESVDADDHALYLFYESLYDRIHHFIFHLFEVGLRVEASSLMEDGTG